MVAAHPPTVDIEREIQERGRALLGRVEPERLITLSPAWWQERLMGWAMADPDFRVKLLRFVDVLPSLRSGSAVADHLRQYFRGDAPLPIRMGSAVAGTAAFRPVLSKVVRQGVFTMADRFIGGSSPQEALARLTGLNGAGTAYTVDLLGEATLSETEADDYLQRYLELIDALGGLSGADGAGAITRPNVSLKLSALTSQFEPAAPRATCEAVLRRLVPLLAAARGRGVFVNIDMEQYRFKDLVQTIAEAALMLPRFRDWEQAGIVVQAYLRDAEDDIARVRALAERRGTPITVRLVKGAYWDEEVVIAGIEGHEPPVFAVKDATDASYERCTAALIAGHPHLRPAFGSHNPRSIAQAMVRVEAAGLPPEDVEFQMLYGMAEGLRRAVKESGYRTRVYVPVGEIIPGMAYLVRRLLENTSNESWLMHRYEEGDPAELLRQPSSTEPEPEPRPAEAFANAPPAEFHLPSVREAMQAAIGRERIAAGGHWPLLIDGREVATAERDEVRYPADPSLLLGTAGRAGAGELETAVTAALAAFPRWRDTAASARAAVLRRAADILEDRRYEFAATMVFESAKPWHEADGDVCEAIDYLRYYAAQADRLARGGEVMTLAGESNRYVYEPRGVTAVIAPWNFPLAIIGGMATAALAAGCVAILKPAEQSPLVAAKFVRLLHEAGVPGGAVQYLPGPGETIGQGLASHPAVDVVAFTGSNAVGLQIAEAAAVVRPWQRNVKRVVLELGGKNAIIVDDDADLDQAVGGVVASAFGYAGQKCSACSRVIVVGEAFSPFRARLAAAVESLVLGPPDDPYTVVPPVISAEAKARIDAYIARGEAEGDVVASRAVPARSGHYVAPHVFEGIGRDSKLWREEIFGPVLVLARAANFDSALEMAMDSPFALTGGLFSRNPARIERARHEFRVGNLYINRRITGATVGRQPFGGLGMSGAGDKAGGPDYLLQFVSPRVVTENTMRRGFAG
ncbi:MAG: bifunctional proline dehydrogenase/L-glutamate gamma-semialdehyde dehydrogenase [Chloroflexi bacterium]|nr:bifunctional proline dehydrogenase/L-glutamate gamma-semialdehyde dehydrogenase [Chloroflexota bacterium]